MTTDVNIDEIQTNLKKLKETDDTTIETPIIEDDPAPVVSEPDYEKQARERGWKPRHEFTGDIDTWVDAEEFIKREPLYKALHKVNRELKRANERNDALHKFYKGVQTREQRQLEEKKQLAIVNQDPEAALVAEEELRNLKETSIPDQDPKQIVYQDWIEDNQWYLTDELMSTYANGLALALISKIDGPLTVTNLRPIYDEVSKKVKQVFKEKFEEPKTTTSSKEEDVVPETPRVIPKVKNNPPPKGPKTPTYEDLPDEGKLLYRKLVKSKTNPHGVMTAEEYLSDYFKQQ